MLMRMGQPHVPSLTDWLVAVLPDNASIGADPKLVSNSQWNKWLASLKEYNVTLKESFLNPIDRIWNATNGRPMYSDYEAYVLELKYAALDEVAWLLNIRGYEIPYNPLVHAYVIVSADMVNLYANETKLGLEVPEKKRLVKPSPIIFMKAKKNPIEAEGMRKSHIRDAVALCDFYAHFEESIAMGKHWDEVNVSLNVDQFRREQYLNKGPSFPTIAGFGPNGAAPHYVPTESQNVLTIDTSSTLVLDSGGQYLGTTS
ncbi:Xaa-Pro aminopeptidase 1 [Blattella germanica]|nr:Xaa-Pro aminopeptidase 1 [Blattella germanica]